MNTLKSNSKILALLGGVAILVGLITWIVYARLNSANPVYSKLPIPIIPTSLNSEPIWSVGNLSLEGKSRAGVYKVTSRELTQEQANNIASKLSFSSVPKNDSQGNNLWTEPTRNLTINLRTGEVVYHDLGFSKQDLGKVKTDETLIEDKVKNFASKLGLNTDLVNFEKPSEAFYKYFVGGSEAVESQPNEANLVVLNYPVEIDGEDLVGNRGAEVLAVKLVGEGQIVGFDFTNLSIESSGATYPLKSKADVQYSIPRGEAGLVTIEESEKGSFTSPERINVGTGKIHPYNDKTTEYIQPVFVFQVELLRGAGRGKGEIYLPAIEKEYFP